MNSSIVFPLPLPIHIVFGVLGVLFFLFMYKRKNHFYYLLIAASMASTFLVYVCTDKLSHMLLGFEELALYIAILVFIFIAKKKDERALKAVAGENEVKPDENSNS